MKAGRQLITVALAAFGLATSLPALAGNAGSAQALAQGLRNAKATVDQAIAGAHGTAGGGTGGNPWGGQTWSVDEGDVNESDALGLPILIQASSSLGQAATNADAATQAFLGGAISFGNFQFTEACVNLGIARSQVSRANTAALQPPVGFLAAFGPDLTNVLVELLNLKATEGCP